VVLIRDIEPADLPAILALNNEHAAEVNALTAAELEQLVRIAACARIMDDATGFVIALDEKTPAHGPNHAWFLARSRAFLYVDRIVIAKHARGRGLARELYADLARVASGRPLCCEVNVDPPNPASLAFHERLAFQVCGEAVDPRNGKRVRYFERR
jgi:predicted GNAT superfamily acetyltransferase